MEKYTHDELMEICERMKTFGGSFESSLATTFIKADKINRGKLIDAFPEYFEKYKKM